MFSALFRRDESGDEAPRSYDVEAPRSRGRSRGSRSRSRSPSARAGFGACAVQLRGGVGGRALVRQASCACAARALRAWLVDGWAARAPRLVPCSYLQPLAPRRQQRLVGSVERCCSPVTSQRACPALARHLPSAAVAHRRAPTPSAATWAVRSALSGGEPGPSSVRTHWVKALGMERPRSCRAAAVPPLPPPPPQPAWARAWPRPPRHPHSLEGGARGRRRPPARRAARAGVDCGRRLAREVMDRAYDDPGLHRGPAAEAEVSGRRLRSQQRRAPGRASTPLPHTFAAAANAPTLHGHGDPPTRPGGHRRRTSSATGGRARRPRARRPNSKLRKARARAVLRTAGAAAVSACRRGACAKGECQRARARAASRAGGLVAGVGAPAALRAMARAVRF